MQTSGLHTVTSVCRITLYYATAAIIERALASPDVRIIVFDMRHQLQRNGANLGLIYQCAKLEIIYIKLGIIIIEIILLNILY